MAKIILLALFSVLGYAIAAPPCTNEEAAKCTPDPTDADFFWLNSIWPADEQSLANACSKNVPILNCVVMFVDRCINTPFGTYLNGLEGFEKLYENLCDKSNEFRKDYLDQVSCLNTQISEKNEDCLKDVRTINIDCATAMNKYKTCMEVAVKDNCGAKAGEVFQTLIGPRASLNIAVCKHLRH